MNKSCVSRNNKDFAREKLLYLVLNASTQETGLGGSAFAVGFYM